MPGSVQNDTPATVMPASLRVAFVREQQVPVLENELGDGVSGLAMTAASGALIGSKFGGPVGAATGAAAGFAAGLIRLFVKGATEKARQKIKAAYGVDIRDKNILQQIVDIAKQKYGSNLDLAIRTHEVRDLVELYALSTDRSTAGLPATRKPVTLAQSGGSLFQQSSVGLSSLTSMDRIGPGTPSNAGPIVIRLDEPATTALLRGEAVQAIADNPRAVQSASLRAVKGNAGRREMLSLQLSPATLLA